MCRGAAIDIVYKIAQYANRDISKTSPEKQSRPGRKTIKRLISGSYMQDIVSPYESNTDDLLRPFEKAEGIEIIQSRLKEQLAHLPAPVKSITSPAEYPVFFV